MYEKIKKDYKANKGNKKGLIIITSYRICNYLYHHPNYLIRAIGFPIRKIRSLIFKYIMGIEIPEQMLIGHSCSIWHGNGLIINPKVILGNNVLLRHTTTIGNKSRGSDCPVIGDNVDIGAHTIIIGGIQIGNNVTIGAGSIITKSIIENSIAYGNPLKIISKIDAIND